jgi:3',5'-cyclic AMP phosphodiesterase CpdA
MTLRILQISDTHLSADRDFKLAPGIHPFSRVQALITEIRAWIERDGVPIDCVIHTGDLVHRGHLPLSDDASTRLGVEWFRSLPIPVYWVIGNHDHRRALCAFAGPPPGESLTAEPDRLAYHFVLQGERILIVDARGPLEIDPQGEISPEQLQKISEVLESTREPITFFMHYPAVSLGCDWIDRTMLVRNGLKLHEILQAHRDRVRGVFFGHIHRPMSVFRDGILYASCGSSTMHFPNWPNAATAISANDRISFAQLIEIGPNGMLIKPQWVELPGPESVG